MTSRFDYAARITRGREAMQAADMEALLLSVGTDLPYLTGYEAMPLERLTMFVLTADRAVLVVPELEAPRVDEGPFEVRPWSELEDPVAIVADLAGGASHLGVGDQTWSVFLLRLQAALSSAGFSSAGPVMSQLRIRKEAAEIELLRQAAHATDRVVARLEGEKLSGLSERQLARMVAAWTVEEGHDVDTFTIIGSGPNGASPHHEPGDRIIREGDMVVIDFGGRVSGYCSDTTRTFIVGEPTPEQEEVFDVVQVAQRAAVDTVRPGALPADIDAAARSVIEEAGYGERFIHRTGHGIGLDVHEEPYIGEMTTSPVEAGMAFSIEPGIYLPERFGVRIEDIVAVSEKGVDPLNRSDHSLRSVE